MILASSAIISLIVLGISIFLRFLPISLYLREISQLKNLSKPLNNIQINKGLGISHSKSFKYILVD